MSNWSNLITAMKQVVKTNGAGEITGLSLQSVLKNMIESVGAFATFGGVATPSTNPGNPDGPVFYVATQPGIYVNFGNQTLSEGDGMAFFKHDNGSWSMELIAFTSAAEFEAFKSALEEDWNEYKSDVEGTIAANKAELEGAMDAFEAAVTDQVNNYKPIEITGDVTNAADEEDLTADEDGLLKLKNRSALNGMGYVILRMGTPLEDQITQANTIYEVRYNFDLDGEEIDMPANCTLKFDGGKLSNGTLKGSNTSILSDLVKIFGSDLSLDGSFKCEGHPEWYGAYKNESTSYCVASAINKLNDGFASVELQAGTYYSTSGETIVAKNLYGNSLATIEVSNYEDDFIAMTFGIVGGSPQERAWRESIRNIRIYMPKLSSGVVGTTGLVVGSTTRALLENVHVENRNERTTEFTVEELESPHNYCNYGVVFNGYSELMTVSHFSFLADIPLYMKTTTDLTSFISGYLQSSEYGFSSIYGCSIGTNSIIKDTDLARGLYGVYLDNSDDALGFCRYDNIRIEQLRALSVGDNYITCNFYINSTKRMPNIVVSNSVLGIKSNGFHLVGSVDLLVENSLIRNNTDESDYSLKIEGTDSKFIARNMNGNFNSPIIVPDGYQIKGYSTPRMSGETYRNANPTDLYVYYDGQIRIDNNSFFRGVGKFSTERTFEGLIPKIDSGASILCYTPSISEDLRKQINAIKYTVEVNSQMVYAKICILLRFKIVDGEQTTDFDEAVILSKEGDEIFNVGSPSSPGGVVSNKINIYFHNNAQTLAMFNRLSDVYGKLTTELLSGGIIQRLS